MITELKSEVEKHFARKITNRGDCEALAQDIYEKTGAVLSYNTIRRIYGLAAYRKPRASTLDQLAAYCGFDSFIEFCQRFHEFDSWPETEEVHVVMAESELDKISDLLRRRKILNQDFASTFAMIVRDLVYRDRLDLLLALFETEDFLFEHLHFDVVSQIGSMVGHLFRDARFLPISKQLLHSPNFRNLVFKSFVDYTAFSGHYGQWVSYLSQSDELDAETKAFIDCLNLLIQKVKLKQVNAEKVVQLPSFKDNWHPILRGRIFAIKFLLENDIGPKMEYNRQFNEIIAANIELSQELLYIPTVHSLLFPEPLLCEFIYNHLKEGNRVNYWYQLSLMTIEQVFIVAMLLRKQEFEQARDRLQQISVGQIRHGYKNLMMLYLSFFNLYIDKHFNTNHSKLAQRFVENRQKINYPLFTDQYFENYFNN